MAALGLLTAGSAFAGHLATTPPVVKSSDPGQIRRLAEALRTEEPVKPALTAVSIPIPSRELPSSLERAERSRVRVTAAPQPERPAAQEVEKPTTDPPPTAEDAVKNIALMGVTHSEGGDQAWLVDLSTQEREVVDEGKEAWGFTVKNVEDDHIILARGGDQFTLRLGEKEIPVNEAPVQTADLTTGEGRRGWGGNGGGEDRRARFRQWMAQNGGGGGRFGGGRFGGGRFGGGSWGGRSGGGGNSSWSSSNNSSNWNRNRGGGRTWSGGGGGGWTGGGGGGWGGFNPASMAFGGGFYGRRNGTGNNAGPTSNPQTARRRGGQLIGGATPIERPRTINNPQTTRRLGTNSGGQAFGGNWNQGNRNQGNRNSRTGR